MERSFLARKLRDARNKAGLSVDAVGKIVGRSGKSVSAWETGRSEPSADMMISLCELYETPISFFYPAPEVGYSVVSMDDGADRLSAIYHSLNEDAKASLLDIAEAFAKAINRP